MPDELHDQREDAESIVVRAQLALAARRAVLEPHRDLRLRDAEAHRVDGELGLDLELARQCRKALHESS